MTRWDEIFSDWKIQHKQPGVAGAERRGGYVYVCSALMRDGQGRLRFAVVEGLLHSKLENEARRHLINGELGTARLVRQRMGTRKGDLDIFCEHRGFLGKGYRLAKGLTDIPAEVQALINQSSER